MISHSGICRAISFDASIIRTAPMAKLGATNRLASPTPSSSEKSAPVVPITQWTPASRQWRALGSAESGVEKSTTTSASPSTSSRSVSRSGSARPTSDMSSAPSTAAQTVSPIRPAAPETATLIKPRPLRRVWRDASPCQEGVDGLQGGAERAFVAPHSGGGHALRHEEVPRQRCHVLLGHRVEGGQHLVHRKQG